MWKTILGYAVGFVSDYVNYFLICLAFVCGLFVSHLYYKAQIADVEAARSAAVAEARAKNAKGVSDATNTILLASEQYDSVVAERDRVLERLRKLNESSVRASTNSCAALTKRAAACERVAAKLLEFSNQCGDGWQRCAVRKDALTEIVK